MYIGWKTYCPLLTLIRSLLCTHCSVIAHSVVSVRSLLTLCSVFGHVVGHSVLSAQSCGQPLGIEYRVLCDAIVFGHCLLMCLLVTLLERGAVEYRLWQVWWCSPLIIECWCQPYTYDAVFVLRVELLVRVLTYIRVLSCWCGRCVELLVLCGRCVGCWAAAGGECWCRALSCWCVCLHYIYACTCVAVGERVCTLYGVSECTGGRWWVYGVSVCTGGRWWVYMKVPQFVEKFNTRAFGTSSGTLVMRGRAYAWAQLRGL